jgi:hypothetical protein
MALKNGTLLWDADGNKVVEILCDQNRAKKTAQLCPEVFARSQHRLKLSGDGFNVSI